MKVNIGTYSFGGIESYLGLGLTLKEKFQKIKSLGFDGVELLPVDLDNPVEDIKAWADEVGLEIVSVHAKPELEIVKKMAALGGKAVIWASTPFNSTEEAIEVAHELDEMAEMAAPYGIKVGYHNHSQEFFVDKGKFLLQTVIDNSSKCYFQLDCGWAQNGGAYPPSFIRQNLNRFIAIHVKENSKVQGPGPRPASRHEQKGGDGWYQTVSSDPKFSADGFLNTDRHLNYKTGGTIDTSLDMATKVKAVSLQISKHENKARENVFSKVTKAYLTRRVFNNNLSLRIHTANDGENGDENVATAPDGAAALEIESGVYNSMKPEILINEHNGGVDGNGHLYVGSRLQVTFPTTDSYKPYSGSELSAALYVTDQDGKIVPAKIEEGSGKDYYVTMLWDGMKEADLSKSYTLNVVMTRRQQLELDLSPSVERKVDSDGSVTADIDIEKTGDAWDVFWTSGADTITVGYSETTQKAPHFNRDTVSEKQIKKTDCISEDQNPVKLLGSMDNVQYINFNRGSGDRIVYNGKMYKGNERIYLTVNDLAFEKVSFLYYAERYLTSPSIMNASISRIELYFDGDGDGQIAGSYNKDTGYFVLDSNTKDTFVMYLEGDGTYDEGMFQPMELEDGGVGQYYAKIFYTMTPRSLEGTGGHAQVLPALATSLTNEVNRAQLTREQRTYRYLLAGPDADGKRTSDNHPMYGAEATAFQYVDVPLGGDHSPLRETEPDVYEWNPRYEGNLLYAFSNPEPIYIEHSLAGDNYPLAKVSYGEATGINIDAAGKANLNGYLGSLVADTTIALCIGEQRLTADDLHENPDSEKNLQLESSALCGFSASPDSSWLTQIDSADMGEAGLDTGDSGQEYPEFDQDYNIDIPFESVSFQGLGTICLSKNVISVVFAVPVLSCEIE